MIKDFLLTRSAPTVSPERLQQYLEYNHAPLALSLPLLQRETKRYTMNHVSGGKIEGLNLYPALDRLATIVEHRFGEGIAGLHSDERYISDIRPDEMFMVEELMDGPPQFLPIDAEWPIFKAGIASTVRVLDFLRRPADMPREDFDRKLADDGAWAAADPRYRAAVERRVHSLVGSGSGVADFGADKEAIDAVVETWITDPSALAALGDEQRARRASFCDADRSFSAVTEERWLRGADDAFGPRSADQPVHAPAIAG